VSDVNFVVQSRIRNDVVQRSRRTALRIGGAKHHSVDARLLYRPGAHHARLERDVERATAEAPTTHGLRGRTQHENFSVSCRVAAQLALVVRPGNDPTFANDDRTHGNVFMLHRQLRFAEGFAHREHVIHGLHSTCTSGNASARSVR